jgi:uncharacterized lipoprotein YddW (UPF0748 family)
VNHSARRHGVPVPISRTGRWLLAILVATVAACTDPGSGPIGPPPVTPPPPPPPAPQDTTPPVIQREMRGMWIATVANIDWPSRSTLTADQQRAELIDILTRARNTGINTIVLQVRPAADALYASAHEPWGMMLTGTQGIDPGYDPLAFAVQEAHARGLELHAWINPFRAGNTADTARLAPGHLFHTRRDLIRVYGTHIWMDPGEPEAHNHTLRVVADIIGRYDIDAIHLDDYFYPYVQSNAAGPIPFPDDETYQRYGSGLARDDWRRDNVNRFIKRLYDEVHQIEPTMKVGLSPFGIWRPGSPPGVQGLDAYASIYADSRKWLREGWVDYFAPQLYWAISAPQQSFSALLDWWLGENVKNRHVWPGLAAYKVNNGTAGAFSMTEIPDQIRLTRTRVGGTGQLLYNTSWTLKNNSGALATALAGDLYSKTALPPAYPWLGSTTPTAPTLTLSGSTLQISGDAARWWAVRERSAGVWATKIVFGTERSLPIAQTVDRVLVQAVDRVGNISQSTEWRRP